MCIAGHLGPWLTLSLSVSLKSPERKAVIWFREVKSFVQGHMVNDYNSYLKQNRTVSLHFCEVLEQATLISSKKKKRKRKTERHGVASGGEVGCEYALERGKKTMFSGDGNVYVLIWVLSHMGVSVCHNLLYCSLKVQVF